MKNVSGTPKKVSNRRKLFELGERALEQAGWRVERIQGIGKSSVRRIVKGDEQHTVSIRTTQDTWIAFPRNDDDNGWVTPAFDWTEWQESAKKFVDSPKKIEKADATTIQKLLTTHSRADRFCEGHLASMFESGHIVALLRRLREIRASMG